ncbi:Tetratricopeptide-like helical domain superfamily, partial [Sesbania bispinosa]
MSSAALHLRSPINSPSDATPHSPFHHTPFNADALNPSISSAARGRSRPRLVKLRKQSASQHARSRTRTATADDEGSGSGSGFNPFRSDQGTGKGTSEKGMEFGENGGVEFVFSAQRSDVKSDSLPERGGKSSENEARTVSGDERKMTLDSEREQAGSNFTGFVFSAGSNNLASSSNTKKGKSSVSAGNSGFDRECKNGFVSEKQDGFSDNHSKTSSFNVKKQESIDSMRKSSHGVSAFTTEMKRNCNCDKDAVQCDHACDDDKCKRGYGSINGVSATYSDIPAYKLPDEMEKLNINYSEGADITRDSMKSRVNSCATFVFGGSNKDFGNFSVSSGTNADAQQSCTNADFENIGVKYGCGIACGSTGIPCSKPSTSQEGARDFQSGKIPESYVSKDSQVNGAATPFSSSSIGLDSHPNYYASMGPSLSADNDKRDNPFASIPEASKESFMDFKPPTWDPSCFKDNLFPKLNKKLESAQKSRFSKEKGSKCMRRKLRPHSLNKKQTRLDHLSKENTSLETPDISGSHSPMDFSPYQETAADDQHVKASEELNDLHSTIPVDYKDEHLASVGSEDINTTGQRCGDLGNDNSCNGSSTVGDVHSSGPEMVWPNKNTEQFSCSGIAGASADAGVDITSNSQGQKANGFCFVHGPGGSKEKDFTFSASSTVEGASSVKRKQKKFRRKMRSQINNEFEERDGTSSSAIQEACYKWRLRGNQAHKDGDLSKAEGFYTLGINSVPSRERSGGCIKPLLLCYSNRAATRMSLGRIREALEDCMMATSLDPTFLKIQMRTANCHLLLGEVENAQQCYNKCLESGNVVCLDRRVIVEAAEGLQKAQEVVKFVNDVAALLNERTSDAAGSALELLTKALSISLYSEKLLHMKAEALCLLQKYEAAIQLCEQSQYLAEKNFALENSANNSNSSMHYSHSNLNLWRWSVISRCYFHLGKLEASLNVIEKLHQVVAADDRCMIDNIEDLLSLATTIRELLGRKSAGNENFKLGKYTEAVDNYTVALSSNIKPRPFAAICFCNRAAAYQSLGQIADAIADCSMAMALDGNYVKAISRRATLHEMVRDYEQAACDLRRLVSVIETQSNEKASGSSGGKESRQVYQRLLSVEDQAKKGTPLDFYLILGIKPADTATDIKKAYHKAALKHHPDK